jgi:A/G-specific adenine glycosylase
MQTVKPQPLESSTAPEEVRRRLLPWFARCARVLPWRRNRTPYRVWVAEVMLQQTRVETVVPYYRRWMRAFPSWRALARAAQSDVLKQWEGLGYYSRARNLHRAAQCIVSDYNGRPPQTAVGLRQMPGVGPYTAAAIASLAFGEAAAVVDGNVIRVLSRLYALTDEAASAAGRKQVQALADSLLAPDRPGEFNEAMMELGALVCLPQRPQCERCPLQEICVARASGDPEAFPVVKKKKSVPHLTVGAAVISRRNRDVLIARRREQDMLGGLWEFPGGKQEPGETMEECVAREIREELGVELEVGAFLMTVRHAYSHFRMTMQVYCATIRSGRPRPLHCADFAWVKIAELRRYAWSAADLHVVARLQATAAENVGKKVDATDQIR